MPDLASKPVRRVEVRDISFERLLDTDEAAALLNIHPKTLQKMARHGNITGVQIGRLWRFRASELDRWLSGKLAG
jgi:excisionase family DNA binding protein